MNTATGMDGLANFRDVAGAEAGLGPSPLRAGRLFRSDSLAFATPADRRRLSGRFRIRAMLDLRVPRRDSAGKRPFLTPETLYANVPLYGIEDGRVPAGGADPLSAVYLDHLHNDADLPRAVTILAGFLSRHPTVVFCEAGKDRTGMVVALALGLAGFSRRSILRDYTRSASNAAILAERAGRERPAGARTGTLPQAFSECRESTMEAFLDAVEDDYGSFGAWGRSAGIPAGAAAGLRAALRNPAVSA